VTVAELTPWMPLIVAGITALAGLIAYARNKSIDRKHALIELRRVIYRDFILAIADVSHSKNGSSEVYSYQKKLAELHLIASDEVILACAEFTALYRMKVDPGAEMRAEKYSKLEMAMRRDCFEKTKITAGKLQEMLPFTF
jgi:hypothetical protein